MFINRGKGLLVIPRGLFPSFAHVFFGYVLGWANGPRFFRLGQTGEVSRLGPRRASPAREFLESPGHILEETWGKPDKHIQSLYTNDGFILIFCFFGGFCT